MKGKGELRSSSPSLLFSHHRRACLSRKISEAGVLKGHNCRSSLDDRITRILRHITAFYDSFTTVKPPTFRRHSPVRTSNAESRARPSARLHAVESQSNFARFKFRASPNNTIMVSVPWSCTCPLCYLHTLQSSSPILCPTSRNNGQYGLMTCHKNSYSCSTSVIVQ